MFGFLKGKIDISIPKLNYSQGETISGTVSMQLKKPVTARAVRISIIAEQKTTRMTNNGMQTSVQKIFDFSQPLDGEKEYTTQTYTYNFEIKVPQTTGAQLPGGVAGSVVKTIGFLSGMGAGAVSWYLVADLDVPKGFDVAKKVQINIG